MAKFDYEFSEQDRQLTINQDVSKFGNNQYDYIRLIVYPSEAIDNIVDLPDDTKGVDGKAIFYSSLTEQLVHLRMEEKVVTLKYIELLIQMETHYLIVIYTLNQMKY